MRKVLITGGSRGIGAAVVRAFTAAGDRVAFFYHTNHTAAATIAAKTGAVAIPCDVSDPDAVRDGLAAARTALGGDPEVLVSNAGKVYSRESLLDLVWGYDYPGDIRTVDVHVRRLREKIEPNSAEPVYLLTKWGAGYYFKDIH